MAYQIPALQRPPTRPPEQETGAAWWGLLGFLVPIVGLVLFIVWRQDKPRSSTSAGLGALVSVLLVIIGSVVVIVVLVMSANSAKVAQEQARIAQEQQAAAAEFAAAMGELTVWHECFISDVEGGETWREEHGTEHGSVELRLGCAEGDVTGLLPILATGDGTENFGDFTRLDDGGAAILVVPEYRPGDDDRPMIFSGSYLFTYDFSIFDNGWIGGLVKPYARTADENDGTVVEYHAVGTIFPAGYAVTEFNGAAHSSCSFQVSQMEPRPAFCG